ncbi:patatin-like phospholipase family protein [Bosea eneae]|uniref:Patatin-like phospholipase family protein n=1 Tax=Bosea eneae TaxID=151454 RepID=A0ABW0IYI6_9HYPH
MDEKLKSPGTAPVGREPAQEPERPDIAAGILPHFADPAPRGQPELRGVPRHLRPPAMGGRRTAIGIAMLSAALAAGCVAVEDRAAVPVDLAAAARIEHVELARVWGDRTTPEMRALLDVQYRQTKAAVGSGRRPAEALKKADFLAISGGGADGAYAAGVLVGWSEKGGRPQFEVVTGVSTGALAAPFAFLGSRYDEELRQVYTLYGDGDIYTSRGLFGLAGSSLSDNTPLRALIGRYLTDRMIDEIAAQYRRGRRLLVQTTNIDAQRPVIWDLSAIAASGRPERRKLIIDILLASAAIPAVFPPVRIEVEAGGDRRQELHVDGGTIAQLFFAPPEIRLGEFERRHFGHIRSRRIFLIRNGRLAPQYATTKETTIAIARRAIETIVKYQAISDLTRIKGHATAAHAQLRFVAIPAGFTAVAKSEFDRDYMQRLFEVGRGVGRAGNWGADPPLTAALAAQVNPSE